MYSAGVYMPSAQFKGLCANPRVGVAQDRPGRTLDEDLWLRSWTNETYLWYAEVPDTNPGLMTSANYFPLLKTPALTPSGRAKDQFHFTYDTAVWNSLSQSGVEVGYGAEWVSTSATARHIVVAYTHPNEPASRPPALLQRGEELRAVDGVNIDTATAAQINGALFPANLGESHSLTLLATTGATRTVTLVAEDVTLVPVMNVKPLATSSGTVGYLQFNDHLAQSELALINAVTTLRDAGATDLILDMRYNGGGYLDIAAELAYMIVGNAVSTTGKTFEVSQYNDKNRTSDIFGRSIQPTPFYTNAQNFSAGTMTLPTLNLSRVYLLVGAGTCSASESLINGLRGIGVEVDLIGSATCGKPYGFYGTDNCGTTYFSIQFQTVNAVGFGSYADGFMPQNKASIPVGTPTEAILPGCSIADDFNHVMGDPLEGRLAAALSFRATATCPVPTGFAGERMLKQNNIDESTDNVETIGKSPMRENRWY
jgi:hypothetical protein